jgi:hypothetical protein
LLQAQHREQLLHFGVKGLGVAPNAVARLNLTNLRQSDSVYPIGKDDGISGQLESKTVSLNLPVPPDVCFTRHFPVASRMRERITTNSNDNGSAALPLCPSVLRCSGCSSARMAALGDAATALKR